MRRGGKKIKAELVAAYIRAELWLFIRTILPSSGGTQVGKGVSKKRKAEVQPKSPNDSLRS